MDCSQVVPTDFVVIPEGPAGTRETLKYMRELIRRGRADTWTRDFAHSIVRDVPPKDWMGEICAVFSFVQSYVRYGLDTNGAEVIQAPNVTLELGYGDCDDFVCCICGLLEALGHNTFICALGFDAAENYSHVIALCVGAGSETPLVALDATEMHPAGWFPPGATYAMIAPVD
jgi:hypothetical protein